MTAGQVVSRRPGHEPLVADPEPLTMVSDDLIDQARSHYHERFEAGRGSQG